MKGAGIAGACLLAIACARDDSQRHELDGLTVITAFDDPICAGTFPYFERRLRWLEEETGLTGDPGAVIYHWLREPSATSPCGSLIGCAKGRDFYGELIAFSHELVHAHLYQLGSPRPWLSEGMAVMLEDERNGAPHPSFTPSVLAAIDKPREVDYDAAGAFTTYLRERYGMELLLDYYGASTDTDAAMSIVVFGAVFGDSFAEVEADYLSGGALDTSGSLDCDKPDVAWAAETWEHTFRLACDEPDTIGPQVSFNDDAPGTYLWSTVVVTLPAGWLSLSLDASGPTWISLLQCDGDEVIYIDADQPDAQANLMGGRYLVYADAFADEEAIARVTARRLTVVPILGQRGAVSGPLGHGASRSRAHGG